MRYEIEPGGGHCKTGCNQLGLGGSNFGLAPPTHARQCVPHRFHIEVLCFCSALKMKRWTTLFQRFNRLSLGAIRGPVIPQQPCLLLYGLPALDPNITLYPNQHEANCKYHNTRYSQRETKPSFLLCGKDLDIYFNSASTQSTWCPPKQNLDLGEVDTNLSATPILLTLLKLCSQGTECKRKTKSQHQEVLQFTIVLHIRVSLECTAGV